MLEILPDNVTPKSVTISKKADRWFVSFKIETATIVTEKSVDVVGVDLGVKSLATLSTGQNLQEKVVLVLDQKNFLRQFKLQIRLV